MTRLSAIILLAGLSAVALARPSPDGGHFGGHGHGFGGHGGHGHGGYSKTETGHPKLVSTDQHVVAKNPTITTKIKLISKPYPVNVPIKIPVVKHVPVTKTFKNVKTVKVPVHITKTIPFEVVKEVKVPIKVSHHKSFHESVHHGHGGYGHDDFGHDFGHGGHGGFGYH